MYIDMYTLSCVSFNDYVIAVVVDDDVVLLQVM